MKTLLALICFLLLGTVAAQDLTLQQRIASEEWPWDKWMVLAEATCAAEPSNEGLQHLVNALNLWDEEAYSDFFRLGFRPGIFLQRIDVTIRWTRDYPQLNQIIRVQHPAVAEFLEAGRVGHIYYPTLVGVDPPDCYPSYGTLSTLTITAIWESRIASALGDHENAIDKALNALRFHAHLVDTFEAHHINCLGS